jgi:hypothetical protein
MKSTFFRLCLAVASLGAGLATEAASRVTSPKEFFGSNIGDDYFLANYRQLTNYWMKLDRESSRLKVVSIGLTEEGRPQLMGIVTSPANHRSLARYEGIVRRLAQAEGVSEAEARRLSAEGKAVVWIDGGLHASEVLGAHQLMETLYQFVNAKDEETLRILDDVIILFVHANPDGMELCSDWYMREADPTKRSLNALPRLYQKYIGHDNNRDFFASTQSETKNMNRVMYREWFPQIVYNHHQTGPPGTVLFCPPFRDPFNYNVDPLVTSGIDAVGAAMMQRFLVEGKPGATVRSGSRYSTWWNGGLRTTCYFHNMIGLLTESIGSPTPMQIPFNPAQQLPKADYLMPIAPQTWHFRQSVDYSVSANKAVLDYASRHRQQLLYNAWLMGKNAIERGNRASWTITPKLVEAAQSARANPPSRVVALRASAADLPAQGSLENPAPLPRVSVTTNTPSARSGRGGANARGGRGGRANASGARGGATAARGGSTGGTNEFTRLFRNPANRDPRGYIIPANQPDFLTATKFVNILFETGVKIHRATADFEAAGKYYPAGSYVVKCAQAFRAHVLDQFEPQDHPNDFAYPGAPPTPPYDITGWTLAYQMAVQFDRVLDGFEGPFEEIKRPVAPPPVRLDYTQGAVGFFLGTQANDSFRAVNRLLAAGEDVRRLQESFVAQGEMYPAGTFFVARRSATVPLLEKLARELGTRFTGSPVAPGPQAPALKRVRIGLWDRYGGSMPSGWTRWLLEKFEFPFQVVFAPELDKGGLREKYDALIFVDGAIPARAGAGGANTNRPPTVGDSGGDQPQAGTVELTSTNEASLSDPYRNQRGGITAAKTIPQLRRFLEEGGTVLTIGSSTSLGYHLSLPLVNQLVEQDDQGRDRPLAREKFYVPGSVLRAQVDSTHWLAWGLAEETDVMFSSSPAFRLLEGAETNGLRRVAWFDSKTPLRSGWAWGQEHLEGGVAIAAAKIGQGTLALFGPEILFRAQPHGTFKFLFNGLFQAGTKASDERASGQE